MGGVKQDSSRSLCCLCPTDRRRTSADIVTEIQPLIRTITFSSRYLINISCPHSELKGHTCICAGLLSAASGSAFIPVVSISEHSDPFGWVCTLLSRGGGDGETGPTQDLRQESADVSQRQSAAVRETSHLPGRDVRLCVPQASTGNGDTGSDYVLYGGSNPDETESSCAADWFWIRGAFKSSFCSATVFSDDGRRTFLPDRLPSSLKASQHQEPNDPFRPRSQSFDLIPSKTFQIPPADELIFGSD
ncbi:hypothetical protein ATANTOWER_028419 [Ataeniobius toweri]|uniref:Uncharacterized protein n=1 Tax=Ataeniobius toweri TaxID=208326 RepID=A0ABU7A8R0_9TELE|nr:hypothetical protein [Ataeniobius toweri]